MAAPVTAGRPGLLAAIQIRKVRSPAAAKLTDQRSQRASGYSPATVSGDTRLVVTPVTSGLAAPPKLAMGVKSVSGQPTAFVKSDAGSRTDRVHGSGFS